MATVTKFSDLDLTKQYSYSDYLLWQFQERVELIKGFIMKMSPAPSMLHQRLANNLTGCFYENLKRKPCSSFPAPFDVRLAEADEALGSSSNVVQPDVTVVCDKNKLDDKGALGSPDLVIEILSPSSLRRDTNEKFYLYERFGIKEYWIVDPDQKTIEVMTLAEFGFKTIQVHSESSSLFTSPLLPDFSFPLKEIF